MNKVLLNLGFDYFSNGRTGIGVYSGNIIWGLEGKYDIIVPEKYKAGLPPNANPIKIPMIKKKLMGILKPFVRISFFFKDYDVVIADGSCFKRARKIKQIVIVHDMMSYTEPRNYTFFQRMYHHFAGNSYKNADKIIAVSQSTKQALHDLLKIDFNKIIVLPNITNFYIQHKKYEDFLFIGDMRKTKNLEFLIKGFFEYIRKFNGFEKLIIAGAKKFEYENLIKLVQELKMQNQVFFTGYITDDQKVEYFSKAKAFVFLSDNEGFGIPLLEACVNSVPVLCSDIPVFHEILNDSFAIFVNNKDSVEIAEGFERIKDKRINPLDVQNLKNKYSNNFFNKQLNNFIRNYKNQEY